MMLREGNVLTAVKVLTAVRQRMLFYQTITDVWCYFE